MKIEIATRISVISGVCLVSLSLFYYLVIFSPQKEKEIIALQKQVQQDAKEQQRKEYIAKRKNDCYSIYEKERKQWNNVSSMKYEEKRDACVIRYKTDKWKGKNCEDLVPKIDSNKNSLDPAVFEAQMDIYVDCVFKVTSEKF